MRMDFFPWNDVRNFWNFRSHTKLKDHLVYGQESLVACRLVSYRHWNGTKSVIARRAISGHARSSTRARRSGDNPSPIVNALMELLNANARVSRSPILRGPLPSPCPKRPDKINEPRQISTSRAKCCCTLQQWTYRIIPIHMAPSELSALCELNWERKEIYRSGSILRKIQIVVFCNPGVILSFLFWK